MYQSHAKAAISELSTTNWEDLAVQIGKYTLESCLLFNGNLMTLKYDATIKWGRLVR